MRYFFSVLILLLIQPILHSQERLVFETWKDYKNGVSEKIEDSLVLHFRENKDVKIYGGNDYEIISLNKKFIPEDHFAIKINDSIFINGKKIDISFHFCQVVHQGKSYLVFYAGMTDKRMSELNEVTTLYGAAGHNVGKMEAELNLQRYLYLVELKKKKFKPQLLNSETMKKLLEDNNELYAEFLKDPNRNENNTILKYIMRFDSQL